MTYRASTESQFDHSGRNTSYNRIRARAVEFFDRPARLIRVEDAHGKRYIALIATVTYALGHWGTLRGGRWYCD